MTKYTEPTFESYGDLLKRLFPTHFAIEHSVLTLTFQVTEDCCMACTYCYQHNKSKKVMSFDIAKSVIDNLLADDSYYHTENVNALVLEFIGGEPLLEIQLIHQITDYFLSSCLRLGHRFLYRFRISMASNGLLYFTPEVQKFIQKYGTFLSLTISLDGNKELHDSCRLDLQGNGTYDRAVSAIQDLQSKQAQIMETKMTLSPDNISYTYNAITNLIELGYEFIHLNCIYEEGWTLDHAKILYNQLKQTADWLLDNDKFRRYGISMFSADKYHPMSPEDTTNWCGGVCNGMLAFDPDGQAFPCIRYMSSSLNGKQPPYTIGSINGLFLTQEQQERRDFLTSITRQSQSTEECLNCPVAKGCSWCSGYNYECFGTPNKRATNICWMHKAISLANAYYYNKGYYLSNEPDRLTIHLPKEDALQIVDEKEWLTLKFYEGEESVCMTEPTYQSPPSV